jgi:hypothetical protein
VIRLGIGAELLVIQQQQRNWPLKIPKDFKEGLLLESLLQTATPQEATRCQTGCPEITAYFKI